MRFLPGRGLGQNCDPQPHADEGKRRRHEVGFVACLQSQSFPVGNRLYRLPDAAVASGQDQIERTRLAQSNRIPLCEGMSCRGKHNQAVLKQRRSAQFGVTAVPRSNANIHMALKYRFSDSFCHNVRNLQADSRMDLGEAMNQLSEHACADCWKSRNRDEAGRSNTQLVGVIDDSLRIVKQPLQGAKHLFPGRRQRDSTFVPVKELDTQAFFQLLYLDGERRLRDMQVIRRSGEIASFGDLEKGSDVT